MSNCILSSRIQFVILINYFAWKSHKLNISKVSEIAFTQGK